MYFVTQVKLITSKKIQLKRKKPVKKSAFTKRFFASFAVVIRNQMFQTKCIKTLVKRDLLRFTIS